MKLLTAAEKRRRDAQALSESIRPAEIRVPRIPTVLITTDRVLARWGCDGTGMPATDPDAYREALPPPLDPVTFTEVNDIVRRAPSKERKFAIAQYRAYNPALMLEKNFGMSVRERHRIRVDVLHAFKAWFLSSKHAELVELVRFIPEGTAHAPVDCPPNLE